MHDELQRGRLAPGASAPARGERAVALLELRGVLVEQILSGELPAPLSFTQTHDEWVLVLEGGARLELGGEQLELGAGDWLLLPAEVPHRLLETRPGTSWLALHLGGER